MNVVANISRVHENIRKAAEKSGRNVDDITLIAVTKYVDIDSINTALHNGISHIGENRVQEARTKFPLLDGSPTRHLIGSLQTNKVKQALELFDMIHSVDRPDLLEELACQTEKRQQRIPILFQVNVSGELSKHGMTSDDLHSLITKALCFPSLELSGLMTMAPLCEDPEQTRPVFRRLRELFEEAALAFQLGSQWRYLSMGMSQDYQIAVEEGANLLRVGSAIFRTE